MIKVVLFDYGGVITKGGRGTEIAERIAAALDINPEYAETLIRPIWREFIIGKIDSRGFWKQFNKVYGKEVAFSKVKAWNGWDDMKPEQKMLDLIDKLKSRGYRVGLVSNIIAYTEKQIREHGIYNLFDPCLLSCKIGIAKPNIEIYQAALDLLPDIKSSEIIFIDDQFHCLLPAEQLGMKTLLASSQDQVIKDLDRLLRLA